MNEIIKYFENHGGFATMTELKTAGFHTRNIASLVENGIIDKIKSGLYRIADYSFFENVNVSYLTICRAEPKGVICLISALDYHDLTTFNPSEIYYAIPISAKPKTISYPPVKAYFFTKRFYEPGIETIKTKFGDLRIYNKEKTICDMFRYRNKLGEDLAIEALQTYLRSKDKNIGKLIIYAKICQVKTVIMPMIKGIVAV
ncbi:MAG: type IV toxin-antitoxin system AbiEi family antitoxin domain-containing protein [Ignavibacteriales bacterium]